MPYINAKNFGRFYFRTEVISENLTSEIFCSTNFLLSENYFFRYLKIITYYIDSPDPNRVVLIIVENVFFLFMQISGMHIVLFQLLDSSSLLVSSDVQRLRLLPLQKQIPDEDPFKNIRITQ